MTDFEKENFASNEASNAMAEIGFDEKCMGQHYYHLPTNKNTFFQINISNKHCSPFEAAAPLFSQCRKWFVEKHNIELKAGINYLPTVKETLFYCHLWDFVKCEHLYFSRNDFVKEHNAYNEAIIAACNHLKAKTNAQP